MKIIIIVAILLYNIVVEDERVEFDLYYLFQKGVLSSQIQHSNRVLFSSLIRGAAIGEIHSQVQHVPLLHDLVQHL